MSYIIKNVSTFSSLKPEHREAIGLLSIGTFLEYFDLMLYVHMAVVLNPLFFPKTDPYMAGFISAIAFCSTYVFRPFGKKGCPPSAQVSRNTLEDIRQMKKNGTQSRENAGKIECIKFILVLFDPFFGSHPVTLLLWPALSLQQQNGD